MKPDPRLPQMAYTVTFRCGHTANRKTRIDRPGYVEKKQRLASLCLCPACAKEQELAKDEARFARSLSEIPANSTELEKVVALNRDLHPGFVVSDDPITEPYLTVDDYTRIWYTKRKGAETLLRRLHTENPDAHIALIVDSDNGTDRNEYEVLYVAF